MPALDAAVELLDRSLAYTRVALASVSDEALARATPCRGWDLAQLLAHMEDALDAFGEGASGSVSVTPDVPSALRVRSLQAKACALLGAWSQDPPEQVRIGPHVVETRLLVLTAALEVAVHGWDVSQALGLDHPLPDALAHHLLAAARQLVDDDDRGSRFDEPRRPAGPEATARLLAFLGRDLTGPHGTEMPKPDTGPPIAS